ncbi:MAG: hypothetical protein K0Q65_648 [Clostridia bacterium]|nr:hypothetical protein [Clostridia bacterium]
MKKNILFILIISIFVFTGCTNIYLNDNNTSVQNKWFSPESHIALKEYIGKVFEAETKQMKRDELISLISNPINLTECELLTNNGILVNYKFEDIDYYQEAMEIEIDYYNLTKDFSSDAYYYKDGATSILLDYKSNMLIILNNELDKKTIINAYKFNDKYKLKDLTLVGGYEENQNYYTGFIDKDNILYIVDVKSMQTVKTRRLGDNKFLSAYTESEENSNLKGVFLYLLNEKDNRLVKLQLPQDEVIFEQVLDERIKGEVIQIVPEGIGGILILTKTPDKYVIYTTNEDDFRLIFAKSLDLDNVSYKNIDAIRYYSQNEQNIFVILIDKKGEIPISKIDYLDLSWEEIVK